MQMGYLMGYNGRFMGYANGISNGIFWDLTGIFLPVHSMYIYRCRHRMSWPLQPGAPGWRRGNGRFNRDSTVCRWCLDDHNINIADFRLFQYQELISRKPNGYFFFKHILVFFFPDGRLISSKRLGGVAWFNPYTNKPRGPLWQCT